MEENQTIVGENVVTTTTPAQEVAPVSDQPERTYTKAEVQDLMRRRVERSHNAFFKRYGVENLNGLDELMKKTIDLDDLKAKNGALVRDNAYLRNNINPEKYNEINEFFKDNFNEEDFLKALKEHPDWIKQEPKITTIKALGSESHKQDLPSDKERASKLLGVKF